MKELFTVTVHGVSVQEKPTQHSKTIDSLTTGDQVTILSETEWPYVAPPKPAPGWKYGRVSRIANNLYAEERTKQCGWVYTKDTGDLKDIDETSKQVTTWLTRYWWVAPAAAILASVAWLWR